MYIFSSRPELFYVYPTIFLEFHLCSDPSKVRYAKCRYPSPLTRASFLSLSALRHTYIPTYLPYLFHTVRYYDIKFHYYYTVLEECLVGALLYSYCQLPFYNILGSLIFDN